VKSWRQLGILGVFLLVGLISFSTIINNWFLSDDFAQIGKVLNGDLSVVWGKAHGGFFRPLFILSYLIDTRIWGAKPFGFHLTNIVFHSLNAFLTFLLSRRLIENLKLTARMQQTVALGAGALFLLHPSHTEAVSWISGRADIFATFFCLAVSLVLSRLPARPAWIAFGNVTGVVRTGVTGEGVRRLPPAANRCDRTAHLLSAFGQAHCPASPPDLRRLLLALAGLCPGSLCLSGFTRRRIRRESAFEFCSGLVA
jgi:hypothetical protein